jgi:uncharacterized protein (DUF697 family)
MLHPSFDNSFRQVWEQVRWSQHDYRLEHEPQRVVIAGLPGAGKRTLFNTLWGQNVMRAGEGQPLPPTGADFGLFRLLELPCDLHDADPFLYGLPLDDATAIVYLLHGKRGVTAEDFAWLSRLRVGRAALLVVLNQIDGQPAADLAEIEAQLALRVVPIQANQPDVVRGLFVEALLRVAPGLLTPLASQLATVRHNAAQRLIRQATLLGMAVSVEPLPLLDLPLLVGIQLRLLAQLGTLYGKRINLQDDWQTVLAVAFGLLLRYGAQTALKFIPWGGWIISGVLGASATWAVGQAAVFHYEDGWQRLSPVQRRLSRIGARLHVRPKHRLHR